MSERKRAVKSFLLSFSAAFLVLAVIAATVAMTVGRKSGAISSESEAPVEDSYIPSDDDDLTVLLCFHEKKDAEETTASYHLIHLDAKTARTLVIPLPYQTAFKKDGEKTTLDALWKEGGGELCAGVVQENLQLTVDAYLDTDLAGLEELIGRIGTIKYEVKESAGFVRDGRNVALSRGKQLLDAQKIVDLGYYRLTTQGEMARNEFLAEVVSLFMEKRIAPLYLEDADELFHNLLDCFQTNLSAQDYVRRSGFFKSLFAKSDRTVTVKIGGRYYGGREEYVLSDTTINTLRSMFR
ncbi:LCP family glycopolymer transferase [Zongyangia hominis]|uniref:LCP family protein n=1 Tax=Zongyangia hominis TaxID=2763677 RepID=A0A926E9S7_9FIRM|nr:LCP family protein [Zongyangia hominis]MBC8570545.1 LCP family protein [Zongyangia hominis]